MPKMATKAADNVFYKARIAAASWNDRLGSREGASEVTGIDRTRLANIELGTINPHPEEVLMLSDTYNAPELQTISARTSARSASGRFHRLSWKSSSGSHCSSFRQ